MLNKTAAMALIAAAGFAWGASPGVTHAATVLNVSPGALCGQTGCFSASTRYTQHYSASGTVGALALDRSVLGVDQSRVVKISFYDAAGNKVGDWGGYSIGGLAGDVVTIGGPAFDWDASRGDLILRLDVVRPGEGGASGGGGFGGGGGFAGGKAGIVSDLGDDSPGTSDIPRGFGGLDAGPPDFSHDVPPPPLSRPALAAIPEPASWAMMIAGFGAAGSLLRRRRAISAFGQR